MALRADFHSPWSLPHTTRPRPSSNIVKGAAIQNHDLTLCFVALPCYYMSGPNLFDIILDGSYCRGIENGNR